MTSRLLMSLAVMICTLTPSPSSSQEQSRDALWSADIDYMIERLELTHPNLYANIPKEEFLEHADELKRSIPDATDVEMVFGIRKLVARIGNTHTFCRPLAFTNRDDELARQFHYYPAAYHPFDDGLYVLCIFRRLLTTHFGNY